MKWCLFNNRSYFPLPFTSPEGWRLWETDRQTDRQTDRHREKCRKTLVEVLNVAEHKPDLGVAEG